MAGHLHARFGVLSLATIGIQYSSKGIDWRTVWLELIRYKDGSIVSISRISEGEVIVFNCSSLMR